MNWIVISCLLLGAASVAAQDPPAPAPRQEQVSSEKERIDALLRDLGSEEFAVRERATESLRALGEAARPALEKIRESGNPEQKIRAGSLLEGLREAAPPSTREGDRLRPIDPREPGQEPRQRLSPFGGRAPQPGEYSDLRAYMEALARYMQERQRRLFGEGQGGLGHDPFEELWRSRLGPPASEDLPGGSITRQVIVNQGGETLSLQRNTDGSLKLEIMGPEAWPGQAPRRTYEAKDLEDFKIRHPEIYETYKDSGIFSDRGGVLRLEFGSPFDWPSRRWLTEPPAPVDPAQRAPVPPVLGVVLEPVPDLLRAHLSLPLACLVVRRVSVGSLAERLGLRPLDILLDLDGRPMAGDADVGEVLTSVSGSEVLKATVVRRGKTLPLETPWPR